MTNEEEKILEEEKDITLEDAAEEAEELQEETQDEVKDVREEIPDDVRLDPDEIRERPVLRDGGLRDAADPNMIQTHLDNFLAKIAGETPVDEEVRNTTEYWLNKIAESGGGGGSKYYEHNITIKFTHTPYMEGQIYVEIINSSDTPITDKTAIATLLMAYQMNQEKQATGVYKQPNERHRIIMSVYGKTLSDTPTIFVRCLYMSDTETAVNAIAIDNESTFTVVDNVVEL